MSVMSKYEFWFVVGSQHLYGEEALRRVEADARVMTEGLNKAEQLPCGIVCKAVATSEEEITRVCLEANADERCAGVITWMHTFSPSKMWIAGLSRLEKPWLHLHTQFNREIPWNEIDMDFMNLNQSAHGDREHGFIGARLRKARKVVSGYWEDESVRDRLAGFMRSAVGAAVSRSLKVCRFGDNMRQVAVTEGDKVEAQLKLGWSVNTHGVGDLVQAMQQLSEEDVSSVYDQYLLRYELASEDIEAVRYQARIEAALRSILHEGGFGAFTTTFEDLHGLQQLPGLACQNLMADGYGFGGEGDWKTAALLAVMKAMAEGLKGGTSFMEDYTYHYGLRHDYTLGAHMLEVCPTVAGERPRIEVHPLSIGDRQPPARLVFDGRAGSGIVATLVDMGGRMRLIVNDVEAVEPLKDMPNLPVARVMWEPMPDLSTATEAWILAGGAHHTVFTQALSAEHLRDWARMMDIEYIHIGEGTDLEQLEKELFWNDLAWKLK